MQISRDIDVWTIGGERPEASVKPWSFSAFGAPMVGILAEKIYGYDPKSVDPTKGSIPEAMALSKGLFSMMAVPFGLCCLFYTPAHLSFRRDRLNVRLASLKETEMI